MSYVREQDLQCYLLSSLSFLVLLTFCIPVESPPASLQPSFAPSPQAVLDGESGDLGSGPVYAPRLAVTGHRPPRCLEPLSYTVGQGRGYTLVLE